MTMRPILLTAAALFFSPLTAQPPGELVQQLLEQNIHVDLRNPRFSDGELVTDEGGVISSGDFRLQAMEVRYIRREEDGEKVFRVEATGHLMVQFGDYAFVGDYAQYDFQTKTGFITRGRSAVRHWYVSGESIILNADGSYDVCEGAVTSCENFDPHWKICSDQIHITPCRDVCAKNIKVVFDDLPIFWFPYFKVNVDSLTDMPVRYRFHVGGHRRLHVGMRYHLFSWDCFRTYLLLDYRVNPGPGGGVETEYDSPDGRTSLYTRNYLAFDRSDFRPWQDGRYRVQGYFNTESRNGCTSLVAGYDRMSDQDVPTDYQEDDFYLKTAERTEMRLRHEQCDYLTNIYGRLRLNDWETVKQEIPHVRLQLRPMDWGPILTDLYVKGGYLDYRFADGFPSGSDFNSWRVEMRPRVWWPLRYGPVHLTPEAGFVGIYYSSSPAMGDIWQAIGQMGVEANSLFHRYYGSCKHLVKPYLKYFHSTMPTVHNRDHHIFGIEDGWYRMNRFTFGLSQRFIACDCFGAHRRWGLDLWGHAFYDTNKTAETVPRYYARFLVNPTSTFSGYVDTAWDVARSEFSYVNIRGELTVSEDTAVAAEWRHRDAYDWRKADRDDFYLDQARSEAVLLASTLSDERDTFLLHVYRRLSSTWAVEWVSRHGWNRAIERDYLFYEGSIHARLHCGWRLRLSYQHREQDDRFTIRVALRPNDPDICDYRLTDYLR